MPCIFSSIFLPLCGIWNYLFSKISEELRTNKTTYIFYFPPFFLPLCGIWNYLFSKISEELRTNKTTYIFYFPPFFLPLCGIGTLHRFFVKL